MDLNQNIICNPDSLMSQLVSYMKHIRPDLHDIFKRVVRASEDHAGYPYTLPYTEDDKIRALCLAPFMMNSMNNLGEAFVPSRYGINVAKEEKELLYRLGELYKLDRGELWGSIVSSGTEGNFMAMAIAKNRFPQGTIYYSESTHYSIKRAARLLGLHHQPIPALSNGEIDYTAFENLVRSREFNCTPIINLNFGTTFTNAIDKVDIIDTILKKHGINNKHIHYDGALAGGMRPFMTDDIAKEEETPEFSFALPISSLTVSGHKWFGSQVCGILLARKNFVHFDAVEYTGSTTTIGSRNAIAILDLWDRISTTSKRLLQFGEFM